MSAASIACQQPITRNMALQYSIKSINQLIHALPLTKRHVALNMALESMHDSAKPTPPSQAWHSAN
jgi:hypothetical protein